jgi:predicted negative regulator of RcsB-dependent stress response
MAEKIAQDSFSDLPDVPTPFGSFMERNQKALLGVAAILILGAGGYMIQHALKEGKAETAAAALSAAKTPDALQDVATKWADTPAGPSAKLLLAEEQWGKGQQDEAIESLRSLLAKSPDHPAVPTARASLAAKLMQQGKNDEAKTLFTQVSTDPKSKFLASYAFICLGDLAKMDGKPDEAEDFYKRAKGDSPFSQMADSHLTFVKFKMPTEIDAPPPAPQPTPLEAPPTPGIQGNPLIQNFGGDATKAPPQPADPEPQPPAPAPADPGKSN